MDCRYHSRVGELAAERRWSNREDEEVMVQSTKRGAAREGGGRFGHDSEDGSATARNVLFSHKSPSRFKQRLAPASE